MLIYLLCHYAWQDLTPQEVSATFGEAVASLVAEIDTIDETTPDSDMSPLAIETREAVFKYFKKHSESRLNVLTGPNNRAEDLLNRTGMADAAPKARLAQTDARSRRDLDGLQVLIAFNPKEQGLKPN